MGSLVEAEGLVTTALIQKGVSIDRKINCYLEELFQFEMSISGVSKTKWFGQGVYEVDGFVMVYQVDWYLGKMTRPLQIRELESL